MTEELSAQLKNFLVEHVNQCKVLVVGDVMLDKYYFGEVTRISPEAPVPITHVLKTKDQLGGAANVAHNLALLGADTSIIGFVGDDHHGESLIEKLLARGIDYFDLVHTAHPTTTKIRIIGGHQQMLRLDFEDASPVEPDDYDQLLANVKANLDHAGAVIISDYGKGVCTEHVCRKLIKMCRDRNVIALVDPKSDQWERYRGASFVTPNFKEFRSMLNRPIRNVGDEIESYARKTIADYDLDGLLVTRSEHGMTLVVDERTDHIKAKAQEVFDVSGAGDTVIAVFALALAGGLKPFEAAYLANVAAGIVVAKVGTYAVSRDELLDRLEELQ
ncbi:MAG: D-glycero-beta-D-manno-heptose-7-phosphate kinase [Selenomonadaceae bacterium]|nr:D-glycero-beta-D-manno-heptose-7-phosphate kinase [Selenomonadaceae bacterium]